MMIRSIGTELTHDMASPPTASAWPVLRLEKRRPGRARCAVRKIRHQAILERLAQGLHRGQEGLLRLGALQGFKATPCTRRTFELIEIPHAPVGQNSADIRLVVDALDLCYTKSHVNTFVIISGDSDFSPLVSKLRENNKQVIGVGVKQSTSDLLIANCDEFIFGDDLVRENQRAQAAARARSNPPPAPRRSPEEERSRESQDARRTQGVELAAETFEALLLERATPARSGPRYSRRPSSAASPISAKAGMASAPWQPAGRSAGAWAAGVWAR